MPEGEGGLMQKSPWYIAGAVVLVALLGLGIFIWYALRERALEGEGTTSSQAAQELTNALTQTQAVATTSIPTVTNPVTAATPAVNPIEATNPFGTRADNTRNVYQNPFQ